MARALSFDPKFAAIHAIPAEIWHIILPIVVAGNPLQDPAVPLLRVSKAWYHLVMSCGSLWSTVHVNIYGIFDRVISQREMPSAKSYFFDDQPFRLMDERNQSRICGRIKARTLAYLVRSAGHPLDVAFKAKIGGVVRWEGQNTHLPYLIEPLFETLRECLSSAVGENGCHLKRWRSVYLDIETDRDLPGLFRGIDLSGDAPTLTTVIVTNIPSDVRPNRFFTNVPRLQSLSTQRDLCYFGKPHSQMRQLTIADPNMALLFDFLNQLPNLEVLSLLRRESRLFPLVAPEDAVPLELTRVSHLTIQGVAWIDVLKHVHFPSLIFLHIGNPHLLHDPQTTDDFFSCLEVAVPLSRLEAFKVSNFDLSGDQWDWPEYDWTHFFKKTHSLRHLVADNTFGIDELLISTILCPLLTDFEVDGKRVLRNDLHSRRAGSTGVAVSRGRPPRVLSGGRGRGRGH